jgi:hypothetical protein
VILEILVLPAQLEQPVLLEQLVLKVQLVPKVPQDHKGHKA